MNPDANMQDQTTDQNDQNDPIMDNKYIVESAKQILNDEQADPGSQDPAAVEWARAKVNLPVADVAPTYAQPQDPAGQGSPDTLQVPHGPEEQQPQTPEDAQALQYLQQQQQAPAPQAPQPDASQEAASPDGHTLYIDRSQSPEAPANPPTGNNDQPNGNQGQQQ